MVSLRDAARLVSHIQMNQLLAAVRKTLGHRDEDTSTVGGKWGEGLRTTTPDLNEKHAPLLAAELPWEETISDKVFFEALLSFDGDGGGDPGNAARTTPAQALRTGAPVPAVATQQWSPEEWDLDNCSLAVVDLRSAAAAAAASSVGSHASPGNEADLGSEVLDPEEPGISGREMIRRRRILKAFEKKRQYAGLRDELLRKGALRCDVIGCCEPRMEKSKKICSIHKGSLEVSLKNKTGPHRWCLYCHTCHPVSAFGEGSRTICFVKHELRKRRIDNRKVQSDKAGKETEGVTSSDASPLHKRVKLERDNTEVNGSVPAVPGNEPVEATCEEAAVDDKSIAGARGDVVWTGIGGQIGDKKDVHFGSYQDSYRCEVVTLKVHMNPDVLLHQDGLLYDALTSLHYDNNSGSSDSGDLFGYATLPSRVGTPAVAGMMPGCTMMTVTSMTLKTETSDSLHNRVSRLIASTGGTGILRDERWGVMMVASGADEDKVDEVYCAAADGNRMIAEHRGDPWPTTVRTPLCVVANDIVTLDLSAVAQPCAVRWLGDSVNTKITATATGESTLHMMSVRVPPTECCSILSVQALVHGQCMGTAFQHILVLPNDDNDSVAISSEINNCYDTGAAADICDERNRPSVIMSRRMRLYRNVTTDLAWLLSAHESGAAYENDSVIAGAVKIASSLLLVYTSESGFPVLEQRLKGIELDLLEYDKKNESIANFVNFVTNGSAQMWQVAACFIPDSNRSLFSFACGGGRSDGDSSDDDDKNIRLREEAFRGFLGTHRATPTTDIWVMLLWFSMGNLFLFSKLCKWNIILFPGKFVSALLPTGLFDGSILTRTIAGGMGLFSLFYSCYLVLVRRDVATWLARRETLHLTSRITCSMFVGYVQHLDRSPGDVPADKTTYVFRCIILQIVHTIISLVVCPLRFERHALTEMLRLPGKVFYWSISSLSTSEIVATLVALLHIEAAETVYLWRLERALRRGAKYDVMHASYREEDLTLNAHSDVPSVRADSMTRLSPFQAQRPPSAASAATSQALHQRYQTMRASSTGSRAGRTKLCQASNVS